MLKDLRDFFNLLPEPFPTHENTRGSKQGSISLNNRKTYQQEASSVPHLWGRKHSDLSENMLRRNIILLTGITFQLSVHSKCMRLQVGNEDVKVTQGKERSITLQQIPAPKARMDTSRPFLATG